MQIINFKNGEHEIHYVVTDEQEALIKAYEAPLKKKLAEEQAARYRKDPDKYRTLSYVADLIDKENVHEPYLGAIGGGSCFILHMIQDQQYCVQYSYLDNKPIWLTSDNMALTSECIYKITPTSLGYVVRYEVDITNYDTW